MKKQIFIDGEYQYDYEQNGIIHTLSYSNSEYWTSNIRGTVALVIKDDGNGYSIQGPFKKSDIDYAEAERLEILLRILNLGPSYEIGTKKPL
jgi:hypothetical protein